MTEHARPISAERLERLAADAAGLPAADELAAEVARHREGDGGVVGYRFDDGLHVFAKRYDESDADLASRAYGITRALWDHDFGVGSPYRVPEPLGYFPEWGVILLRAAAGERLAALKTRDRGVWEDGLHRAAAWLARLHASAVRPGAVEDVAGGVFRLARRVAKAAARRPALEQSLLRLIEELADRAAPGPRPQVLTHGRYHPGHVFLAPDGVTVIDLDRAALTDPAKDVGEFLHRLRTEMMEAGFGDEAARRSTRTFLDGYTARATAPLDGLTYYWSYSVLSTLLHEVRKDKLDRDTWERRLEFYRAEFHDIPTQVAALTAAA